MANKKLDSQEKTIRKTFSLPESWWARARRLAARDGITIAEWIRRCIYARLSK